MENNQNNGQKSKPIISNATVKKHSLLGDIISYGIHEEIEPRATELMRNLITGSINMTSDTLNKMVDKWLYPDGNGPKRTTRSNGVSDYHPHTQYNVSVHSNESKPAKPSINTRSSIDVNYIWVDTEDQARDIINALVEEIDNYGKAKVATLYDMVKVPSNFTDFKFGWTSDHVKLISYYRDRGKYFIDLPKPINIENI